MEVNDLQAMVGYFLDTEKSKKENRKVWNERTKHIIIECFNEVVNRFRIGWEIGAHHNPSLESIYLYFPPKSSEFKGIDGDKKIRLMKSGGVLNFSQTFNGKISIKIQYPTIESVKPNKDFRVIESLSPNEITKVVVLNKISEFLNEMAIWESNN